MTFRPLSTSVGVVEYAEWLPDGPALATVVLVHGGGVGPDGWLETIDGQPGWAPRLAEAGYRAVVATWPGLSASGQWQAGAQPSGDEVAAALVELIDAVGGPVVLVVHSMSAAFGYRIAFHHRSLLRALVALAPAPPGDIQPEPVVLEQHPDRVVVQGQPLVWELPLTGWWQPGPEFVEKKLVGTSLRFPSEHLDVLRAQTVPIPAGLLVERQNVNGAQVHIGDQPVDLDEATAHWLSAHGGHVQFVVLDGDQLGGNGHMLMQETNSGEILELVEQWLGGVVR